MQVVNLSRVLQCQETFLVFTFIDCFVKSLTYVYANLSLCVSSSLTNCQLKSKRKESEQTSEPAITADTDLSEQLGHHIGNFQHF